MKEDQEPQNSNNANGESELAPTRSSRSSARPSLMMSLRNLVIVEDSNDDDDDDNDSFVFDDHIHQHQEFEIFSETLRGFGLITDDETGKHETKIAPDGQEKTPLLRQRKQTVGSKEAVRPKRDSKLLAYNKGQKELFLEVLEKIDEIQTTTRKKKGLKGRKFAFGLMNCLLIAYMFGAEPAHFWILYAIETIFWMSYKFRGMYYAKPLSEALYYLDFCWVMNASGVTILVAMIALDSKLDIIPVEVRKTAFLACFGVFCGPVFLAAMVLPFVAFLFHDVNTMANLIIHLMPSMVMYHFRWHAAEISNAYPAIFRHLVDMMEEMNSSENPPSLVRITLAVYFIWFALYTTWMFKVGLKLPVVSKDKGQPPPTYDTVFHSTWQGGPCELIGTKVWKRPKEISRDCSDRNDYEVRDFLFYMVAHALGSCCVGIILVGNILCFDGGKMVHAALIWITATLCAKRGADRYTYYVTSMYGQKLRKAFKELQVHEEEQKLQKIVEN